METREEIRLFFQENPHLIDVNQCDYNNLAVVKYFVEEHNMIPCLFRCNFEILKYLFTVINISQHTLNSLLVFASENGNLDIVMFLVSKGADVNMCEGTCLRMAAEFGHLKVVQYLASKGVNIQARDNSAVCNASWNRHFEIVRFLISKGADRTMILPSSEKYLKFCEKMQPKIREKAQKKIYFWWIPICYDITHPSGCGKRMMQKNWEATQALFDSQ